MKYFVFPIFIPIHMANQELSVSVTLNVNVNFLGTFDSVSLE